MGWDIDDIILNRTRKLLGNRYAGCIYGMTTSDSPVIIRHRGLTRAERTKIVSWFPDNIRLEFQPTNLLFNITKIYGFGETSAQRVVIIHPEELSSGEIQQAKVDGGILGQGTVEMDVETANELSKLKSEDSSQFRDTSICTDD